MESGMLFMFFETANGKSCYVDKINDMGITTGSFYLSAVEQILQAGVYIWRLLIRYSVL